MQRRNFLQVLVSIAASVLLMPLYALAAVWNKPAFEAKTTGEALKNLGVSSVTTTTDIQIVAPDRAENGAVVRIEITSHIPNTEAIMVLVDKNPTPLIANFSFTNGALPFVITQIKMAEPAEVQAIVKVGNRYFKASRRVEVLEGGCG
jgi:sulfur-oxidizing protein SoxY